MSSEEQTFTGEDAQAPSAPMDEGRSPAGMFRRMAALVYDSLIVVAILMVATIPFLPFLHGRVLRPEEVGSLAYLYWLWESTVISLFFGFFWTYRGQTLGMQAWRLRVENGSGQLVGWGQALLRLACAGLPWLPGFVALSYAETKRLEWLQYGGESLLLLGILSWMAMWFDADRRTWHDRLSGTRVVVLPKPSSAKIEW